MVCDLKIGQNRLAERLGVAGIEDGLSLVQLADAKALTPEFLAVWGWRSGKDKSSKKAVVEIPWFGPEGVNKHAPAYHIRHRVSKGGSGPRWTWDMPKGVNVDLYGHWRCSEWLDRAAALSIPSYIWTLESELDALTMWLHGIPAIAYGGTDFWRKEWASHLEGFETIFICQEPDPGGIRATQKIAGDIVATLPGADVRIVGFPEDLKDANAIHQDVGGDTEAFRARIKSLADSALPAATAEPDRPVPPLADLLAAITETLRRYLVITNNQAVAIALWVAHTHAFDAAHATPYLDIWSATKQSGKTLLLEVLELLVARAWFTGKVTTSVLMRKIEGDHPTLLLDETDAAFKGEREYSQALRGMLNNGYRRGGRVSVSVKVGGDWVPRDFNVYCPKALAGIGESLPDTVRDRSISIGLRRKKPAQMVERFRRRKAEADSAPLRGDLSGWATVAVESLRDAEPDILDALKDRAMDVWEPLLAIADLAGDDWPSRARNSALALSAGESREDDDVNLRLLGDIARVFDDAKVDKISSERLIELLKSDPESPWQDLGKNGLSQRALARMLKGFGIKSKTIRLSPDDTPKGYVWADFVDSFETYLPAAAATSATPHDDGAHGDILSATIPNGVADTNGALEASRSRVADVADNDGDERVYSHERD